MQTRVRTPFLLALAVAALAVAGGDPFGGTWKLNVGKSKFKPGPAMMSETVAIAPGKVTVNEVNGAGEAVDWSYAPISGQQVPIEGMPNSTVTEKRVGMSVIEHTWKLNGAMFTGRGVMSRDSRTFTYTMKGVNSKGEPVADVLLFERQ